MIRLTKAQAKALDLACKKQPNKLDQAGRAYLHLKCALRDAKCLLNTGFAEAAKGPHKVLTTAAKDPSFQDAVALATFKEASDLMDLYDRDPEEYPEGRDATSALAHESKIVAKRYARGKCSLCGGPATPCARRHAQGKSCA